MMLRRINFFIMCFIFGLSVLLILAGNQFRDNTNYQSLTESGGNMRNYLKEEDRVPSKPYDGFPDINKLLEKTRHKIREKLRDYNFNYSGVTKLEDLLMEEGGQPVRSLILSTWRSGTTFLGEVLNAMPGNFYHYEPLLNYGVKQTRGPPHAEKALNTIKSMFKCNFDNMNDYLEYDKRILRHNTRLWHHCEHKNKLCFDIDFIGAYCKLFPFQSMKVVRLRLRLIQEIIQDTELNVKVVLLIRDPRGVMRSRQLVNFCQHAIDCWKPELLCSDMVSDYAAARRLLQQYPDKMMVLRFEDLALKPNAVIRKLLRFLGLTMMLPIKIFLLTHTEHEVAGTYSTSRVSRDVPFRWKHVMNFTRVNEIQMVCKEAMHLWGYSIANNATHMKSKEFYPLNKYVIK